MTRKEHILSMLNDQPDDSFLNYALALEMAKEGDIVGAITQTNKLLEQHPTYLGAYYQLGQWHEALEEFDAAMSAYQQGIALAQTQQNKKAENELAQALWLIVD